MKPPICELCGRAFSAELAYRNTGGDTIEFADYAPLPQGMVGHPQGLVWLCDRHLAAGRALAALPWPEAKARLEREFGRSLRRDPAARNETELWVAAVGPRRFAVLSVLRAAAGLRPVQVLHVLAGGSFRVKSGAVDALEPWRVRLVEAGAEAELRFP
jgi:hypothetical protein